ncbi:hypothetical protein JW916_16265 [Candidatus Sumerlaeota bacterium]|nr:hypothetical protein [Candidatus Sumerlaeota bacterium]
MRVPAVEDSKRLQQALGTGLRKAGYAVDVTGDGEEGLWFADSNDYDAIDLSLLNSNDSLTHDDLSHLFEALWRKDAARSDDSHGGLGLTLVAPRSPKSSTCRCGRH